MNKEAAVKHNQQKYGNVAVLLGGSSAEREVSLRSGDAVFKALKAQGINAFKIDPIDGLYDALMGYQIERAFIALHGRDGEDGVVQGFLKTLGIPFTGCDVASAALSMNKLFCKQIWQQCGIVTAEFTTIARGEPFNLVDAKKILAQLGELVFVKPVKEGSSVGMSKVTNAEQLVAAVALAHQFDDLALVEKFIAGKEYTVTLINGEAMPSISMQTPREFYDYEAKYHANTTQYFCPSGLNQTEETELACLAQKAFFLLGCSGWGRVDFIRDGAQGQFLILEVNSVPGMTETSLVPKAANAKGINFNQLVLQILDTSFAPANASRRGLSDD